jgi:NTP pyrophosphatase (non-canonical NTP hydrolase)
MNLYQKVINKWGVETQINILIEEMSELIFAIQKIKRGNKEKYLKRYNNICEEIADVKIMIEQMDYIYDKKKIDYYYNKKILKLKNKLKKQND